MSRQLTFDLPVRVALGREDFFVAPSNAVAAAALSDCQDWPSRRLLLLGPSGSGKTHLAHVWAAESGARIRPAAGLDTDDPDRLASNPLVVEDAEQLAGQAAAETALFHLLNLAAARQTPLLLTSDRPPRDWGVALPDLLSRLQAMAVTRLDLPDDALLSAVLVKLFADRQIAVSPGIIPYLVGRMDRSLAAARALVAALDARSLAEGRPITRPFAAALLDRLEAPR